MSADMFAIKGKSVWILFVFVTLLLTGCASMSTMQTARTTEKGKFAGMVDGGIAQIASNAASNLPFLEAAVRYGISDKLDAGLKLTIPGIASLDAKYQLLGDRKSKFAGSIGFGTGYCGLSMENSKTIIFDMILPIYFSYHPINWIGLYCSPKYVNRTTINYNNDYVPVKSNLSWYGATAGIRIGKKIAFFAEYSLFGNNDVPMPFSQLTCGLGFGIN